MAYVPLAMGKVAVRNGEQPEQAEGDMVSGDLFLRLRCEAEVRTWFQ